MSRNKLAVGLVSGAIFASGCGQKLGASINAGKGECLPMNGNVELAPQQSIFVGGDIHFGGWQKKAISDRLQLRNIGRHVLQIRRSNDDGGEVTIGSTTVSGNKVSDSVVNLRVNPQGDNTEQGNFQYTEGKADFLFETHALSGQRISLGFTVGCRE